LTATFEQARQTYFEASVYEDCLKDGRDRYLAERGITRETLRFWRDSLPPEFDEMNRELTEAAMLRRDAYDALINAAEALTAVLARLFGRGADELPMLFAHMREQPHSQPSLQALDYMLRLDMQH
jgi:hypothetical protein